MEWIKEQRGAHRAYENGQCVAVVQGSGFQGWRYSLKADDPWSEFYGTVRAAKRAAETALELVSRK